MIWLLYAVLAVSSCHLAHGKQYLLTFRDEANLDISDEHQFTTTTTRGFEAHGKFILDKVQTLAKESRDRFLDSFHSNLLMTEGNGLQVLKTYYISNSLLVDCSEKLAQQLQGHPMILEVSEIVPFRVRHVSAMRLREQSKVSSSKAVNEDIITNQWNIEMIGSPKVWSEFNVTGRGMVFASADTGVEFDHPVLLRNYRGYNEALGNSTHSYHWYDGVTEDIGSGYMPCPINSTEPCDDSGHGTHTTSTSVGINGYGVAPDAKWIACRNMDRGYGSTKFYLNCLQFFLAPFDSNGNNPKPSLRPHVRK